jgi:hypothetical protein
MNWDLEGNGSPIIVGNITVYGWKNWGKEKIWVGA